MAEIDLVEHQIREEARLTSIEDSITHIKDDIDNVKASVDDLVSAWKAASWLVGAIKWLAALAAAYFTIISFIKGIRP